MGALKFGRHYWQSYPLIVPFNSWSGCGVLGLAGAYLEECGEKQTRLVKNKAEEIRQNEMHINYISMEIGTVTMTNHSLSSTLWIGKT